MLGVAGSFSPAISRNGDDGKAKVEGKSFTTPVELLPSNHIAIQVKINGKGPFRLIFDVGAPFTLLGSKAAADSGVTKRKQAGFMLAASQAKAESVNVSGAEVKDLPVMVMDHPALKALSRPFRPIHGIIGHTFFAHYRLTLDYQAKTMALEPVEGEVSNLVDDIPKRMMGPKTAKTLVLAPQGLWGLEVADQDKGADTQGVTIKTVVKDSPADRAGLKVEDTLKEVDGRWTISVADLYQAASKVEPNKPVKLVVIRKDQEISLTIQPKNGL